MARVICPHCAEFISSKDEICPFCKHQIKVKKASMADFFAETEKASNEARSADLTSGIKNEVAGANANDAVAAETGNLKFDADFLKAETAENDNSLKTEDNCATKEPNVLGNGSSDAEDNVGKTSTKNVSASDSDFKEQRADEVPLTRKRHAHKKKNKQELPDVTVDGDGAYNIDTRDVTFFEGAQENYSVKKARGEDKYAKIEWWEIYKWADLYLARRKINKEVNKAAVIEPTYVKHGTLLILCLLFGWMGIHNFYAKNYRKGIVTLSSFAIAFSLVVAFDAVANLESILGSVAGMFGLIAAFLWISDLVAIICRRYRFRESKLKFICKLNLETRKKLGKKYVTINQWFKPYMKKQKITKKIRQNSI